MKLNEKTIWNSQQDHPELVVRDCIKEFNLSEEQINKLRFILMNRGINKWLYARYGFIKLKHEVKRMKKECPNDKKIRYIQEKMQNIAKTPRWVEWGTHIHKKMKNNIREIIIKGRHC